MVIQYPHKLYWYVIPGTSTRDAAGDWNTPNPSPAVIRDCRAEPADRNNSWIQGTDGARIDFNWIIYLPLSSDVYEEGVELEVLDGARMILKDTVKRFSKGQLNMRIWI